MISAASRIASFTALAAFGLASGAAAQVDPQALQGARLSAQKAVASPFKEHRAVKNHAAAAVHLPSRSLWASIMHVPGADSNAEAGLRTAPLSVGARIPGARVRATLNVTSYVGQSTVAYIQVFEEGSATPVAWKPSSVIHQTGPVTITTDPFELKANTKYEARVMLKASTNHGNGDLMFGAAAQVTDIKWEF
ncbi:MAG: hypothetical protein ACOY3Y_18400 [Acidobacteriota bacterium]